MKIDETIENNFQYHAPTLEQQAQYVRLRGEGKSLAYTITELCPNSRERSLAITKLEESIMWANAAIARSGK